MASVDDPVFVPAPELPPGPRNALVIATSRYDDAGLRQLRSPVRDAEDFAAVLADPAIGGFNVTQLIDETESRIRREIAVFLDERGADETILLYLSCHGIQDRGGRLYFAATDTIAKYPQASAVRAIELLDGLDECRARRQMLILDCCFSGSFSGSKGELDLERQLGGHSRGREVLTASRGFEYSFEGEPLDGVAPGSVFTSGLVEGLRTGAADSDKDGHITAEEAYRYAFSYVQQEGSPQIPQRWLFNGEGSNIVLACSAAGCAVTPAPLPEDLAHSLENRHPDVRIGAVNAIAGWLTDPDPARALAALNKLQETADNDIPKVTSVVNAHLERVRPAVDGPPLATWRNGKWYEWIPRTDIGTLEGHTDQVWDVAFSPDGALLATAGADGTVRLWDGWTDEQLFVLDTRTQNPIDAILLFSSHPVRAQNDLKEFDSVAFSPDGKLLAASGDDRLVRVWIAARGRLLRLLEGHTDRVWGVAFSPDGTLLASAGADSTVRLWNAASGMQVNVLEDHTDAVWAVAFSPDGTLLASAGADGAVRVWRAATGRLLRILEGHADGVGNVSFSPNGELLATAGDDGTVRVWDEATGKQLHVNEGHDGVVNGIAFSPDEELLASAGADGAVRLWDAATGKHLRTLRGRAHSAFGVAFSPARYLLASSGDDGIVRFWQ
jgi:WD40 repeat protein